MTIPFGQPIGRALLCLCIMTPAAWARGDTAPSRTETLAAFREQVFEVEQSWPAGARSVAGAQLEALEAAPEPLDDPALELALARILTLADNGHSFHMHGLWTQRYNRVPVDFGVFDDGVFVIIAQAGNEALVGQRLLAIDGHGIESLRRHFSEIHPGEPGWQDQFLPFFLESPQVLNAAGLAATPDRLTLTLQADDGAVQDIALQARSDLPPPEGIALYIAASHWLDAAKAGQVIQGDLPLYLREPGRQFRSSHLPDLDALYVQFKGNADARDEDIGEFVQTVTRQLDTLAPEHVILDQRFNAGGDLNTTRDLMKRLPQDGRTVFVLVSGRTFSAGISSVGYVKQAGGDAVIIVGTPVGDRLEFWAEGPLVELPESGIAFLVATERHNYEAGCQEDDCHGSIRRHPIAVPSLAPDHLVPMTFDDFAAGRDPAMERVSELIRD